MKKIIIIAVVVVLVGVGAYFLMQGSSSNVAVKTDTTKPTPTEQASGTPTVTPTIAGQTIIGKSVEGRDIVSYQFGSQSGTSTTKILFVGGIHGGYEWNTALVAFEMMDYLKANPTAIPANVAVAVIPVLNPDGLNKVVGTAGRFAATDVSSSTDVQISGRYNANIVDLNRNFDCDWQTKAKWQTTTVSGGGKPFSEPESLAMKTYIESEKPAAVVVWYSSAGGVFSSNCHDGVLPVTKTLTDVYAKASGYPAHESFDFYQITGDMVNWLAKMKVPAISVLLTNHTDTEASKNQMGVKALLLHYAK